MLFTFPFHKRKDTRYSYDCGGSVVIAGAALEFASASAAEGVAAVVTAARYSRQQPFQRLRVCLVVQHPKNGKSYISSVLFFSFCFIP